MTASRATRDVPEHFPHEEDPLSAHGNELYLDIMKKVLTNVIYEDAPIRVYDYEGAGANPRLDGRDWPSIAHTMVGMARLDNLQHCIGQVLEDGVSGDFIETGVWRGGACIFMRAILRAHGVADRTVWVADSFAGMPAATGHAADAALKLHEHNDVLAVSLDTVRRNFERYDLLDDQVHFLPGWFKDTLPTAPVEKLAVIRLDGDLYGSTMDALVHLYPKLSPGGFVIVDDYCIPHCRQAVDDFRSEHSITDEVVPIDASAAYWRHTG